MAASAEITDLLGAAAGGNLEAYGQVARWAYDHLERLAAQRLRALGGSTLEPSDLVQEAFVRLLGEPRGFEDRRHFLAFATDVMRNALVDYQRRRGAVKRGGGRLRVTLSGLDLAGPAPVTSIPDLNAALTELERLDRRKAEVVKLRLFWGLGMKEIADLIAVSLPTVERDWRFSRSWLADRLGRA